LHQIQLFLKMLMECMDSSSTIEFINMPVQGQNYHSVNARKHMMPHATIHNRNQSVCAVNKSVVEIIVKMEQLV
jgi:hypothetical protein